MISFVIAISCLSLAFAVYLARWVLQRDMRCLLPSLPSQVGWGLATWTWRNTAWPATARLQCAIIRPGPVLFMVALYCRTRSDNQASSAGSSVQEISSLLLLTTTQAHSLLTYANAGRSFNQRSIPRSPWMLSPL